MPTWQAGPLSILPEALFLQPTKTSRALALRATDPPPKATTPVTIISLDTGPPTNLLPATLTNSYTNPNPSSARSQPSIVLVSRSKARQRLAAPLQQESARLGAARAGGARFPQQEPLLSLGFHKLGTVFIPGASTQPQHLLLASSSADTPGPAYCSSRPGTASAPSGLGSGQLLQRPPFHPAPIHFSSLTH